MRRTTSGMTTVEMLITPRQAVKWLEGNVHNRAVRDSVVERYARDMKAGKWRLTHQGIAFDENDVLVDGQHRLFAIIEADTDVRMMVSYGVPLDAQAVIDDSLPRTMVDVLKITYGQTDASNLMVAVAKRLKQASMLQRKDRKLSRQEIIEAIQEHQEAITFAVGAFTRKVRGIVNAPIVSVIARAWYTQRHDLLARFCAVLSDGRINDEREDSARMLRNWILEGGTKIGNMGAQRADQIYGKTERALAAFLKGEKLGLLMKSSSELFPLPSERAVRPPAQKELLTEDPPERKPRLRASGRIAKASAESARAEV